MSYILLSFILAANDPVMQNKARPFTPSPAVKEVIAEQKNLTQFGALNKLENLGNAGDDTALNLLGRLYTNGQFGLNRDPAKGCSYFARIKTHDAQTAHNLATCYFRGDGVEKDLTRARSLYQKAAGLGLPKAKCALGNMLIDGSGGAKDIDKGMALCREAAEAGVADAQTDLGGYLLRGKVYKKNNSEARKWLGLAADQRHPNAAFLLGQVYSYGDGVDKDFTLAEKWWKVAYEGGRKDAAFKIAGAKISTLMLQKPESIDAPLQDIGIWLQRAQQEDPDPSVRAKAVKLEAVVANIVKHTIRANPPSTQ